MTQLSHAQPAPADDEPGVADDVLRLLNVMVRGWAYIALACLIALTAGAVYLARARTVYKGFARVLVLHQGGRPIHIAGGGGEIDRAGTEDYVPTHIMIIRSPLIVKEALKTAGLEAIPLRTAIQRLTVTRPEPAAKILEIGYQADTKEQAVKVVDGVVVAYQDFLKKNYQNNANDVIALITNARETIDTEIKELEAKYVEFHRTHSLMTATQDGRSLTVRRLDHLDSAHNDAVLREMRLKSQLDLGRRLASEGKGLWAIAGALKTLGEGVDVTGQAGPAGPEAVPRTAEELRAKLDVTEEARATAEQMVASLRAEQAALDRGLDPRDDEVMRVFRSDPDVAALFARLTTAVGRRDLAKRTARSGSDPSSVTTQRKVTAIQDEIDAIYRQRRPALLASFSRGRGDETETAVRRSEAELVVLRAQESVLRDRLAALGGVEAQEADAGPKPAGGHAGPLLDSIEQSLKAIESMRADLRKKFDDDLKASKDGELDRLTEANLRSNLDRARAMFNSVVEQLKQAQLVSDYSSINAETLQEPDVTPLRPSVALILGLALAVGFAAGTVAAYAADTLDPRIRSLPEIRKALDMTVLGLVSQVPTELEGADHDVGIICMTQPRSMIAESYKSIRTNLEFHRRNRLLQILLVTSPHSGDGKSTSASNIAISLAHAGRRVLLVDADLRRPSQHLLYGLSRERGLSQVLRGVVGVEHVTQPTKVENLDFVSCGPAAPNPAELLASPAFGVFLGEVRKVYDYVIIDSSPLLAVTDPCVVAAQVDGIILIVRATTIKRHEAQHTGELLRSLGTPVVGAVINGITRENTGFGTGNGYGYGYGYGYGRGYGFGTHGAGVLGEAQAADPGAAPPAVGMKRGRQGRSLTR